MYGYKYSILLVIANLLLCLLNKLNFIIGTCLCIEKKQY